VDPGAKTKVLFVCDQNRLRSRTAQAIFDDDPRLDVMSAGIRSGAVVEVTREPLDWADVIFVMERSQRNLIRKRFEDVYERKRIVCLYIPDAYAFMDPTLVRLLSERVAPHLAGPGPDA
jgi:predicted protein tyrosine phosphatase